MAILELEEEHDGGPPLYLRPWEVIHNEVPALRYLVLLRLVEFKDWQTPVAVLLRRLQPLRLRQR